MKAIRAFFAISLPGSVQKRIWDILEPVRKLTSAHFIRWTKPEHLHITLQFLQKLEADHISSLIEGVRNVLQGTGEFQLDLGTLEWFPTPKRPRLISLSVGPQDLLRDLSVVIGQVIGELNYPVESRPFRGHLTVGRVVNYSSELQQLLQMTLPSIPPVPIDELYLIESKPDQDGSNYLPLAQFNLIRNR